jgi:hypothetical protein
MTTRKHSASILRDYAREMNNVAFHLEEEIGELHRAAGAKAQEAEELRDKARRALIDAEYLEAGE